MPRQNRINVPGTLHHIMGRGIERRDIFIDEKDFEQFLNRLGKILIETQTNCYAWALMNNHFHLLLQTGETSISVVMSRLLTSYAIYFNRRHKRTGHLFQNRFKSILCEEESYLTQLVRYIHLNPIRAGIIKTVEDLFTYKYTGHTIIMGHFENKWQDFENVLGRFVNNINSARKAYLDFIADGVTEGHREDLSGGGILRTAGGWKALKDLKKNGGGIIGDERILGDSLFVEKVLQSANEKQDKPMLFKGKKYSLEQLTKDVCKHYKVNITLIRGSSKQQNLRKVRSVICYLASTKLRIKGVDISNHLNIDPSTVSKLIKCIEFDNEYQIFLDVFYE